MCDPPSWYGSAMNATSGLMVAAVLYAVPLVFLYVGHTLLTKTGRVLLCRMHPTRKRQRRLPQGDQPGSYANGRLIQQENAKHVSERLILSLYSNKEGNWTTLANCVFIYLFTSLGPSNKSTCPIKKSALEFVGSLLHFLIALLRIR